MTHAAQKIAIEDFLHNIAQAVGVQRADLILFRHGQNLTNVQAPFDYLKPSEAGVGDAEFYTVQLQRSIPLTVCSWRLVAFPGCCAFMVSTAAHTGPSFQGKGVNKLANAFRQMIARFYKYSAIICTDNIANSPERRTLAACGWKDIYVIDNKRTGNRVAISIKEL